MFVQNSKYIAAQCTFVGAVRDEGCYVVSSIVKEEVLLSCNRGNKSAMSHIVLYILVINMVLSEV